MLPIRVLGRGLIPRGYGIAPRMEPFKADLNFTQLIINTPGLKVEFIDPDTREGRPLTRDNVRRVYEAYHKRGVKTPTGTVTQPHVPSQRNVETPISHSNPNTGGSPTGINPLSQPDSVTGTNSVNPVSTTNQNSNKDVIPTNGGTINQEIKDHVLNDKKNDDDFTMTPITKDSGRSDDLGDKTDEDPEKKNEEPKPQQNNNGNQRNQNWKNNNQR